YFMLSEIDRRRPPEHRLSSETVRLLVGKFSRFGDQYPIFSEFYNLDDASIAGFLKAAETLDGISPPVLKANSVGIFQANVGLWQIFARQGQIPAAKINGSWQQVVSPFEHITTANQLFDAGRSSLEKLLQAAGGGPGVSQEEVADLLAGPDLSDPAGQQVRQQLAARIRTVFEPHPLLSLDTINPLPAGLDHLPQGNPAPEKSLPLA